MKLIMTSGTEDELSQSLSWSEVSYSLADFVTEFALPQVVKVVRGHDGGTSSTTIGYGEVLTLHALRETRVLRAEDRNGNSISLGLDFPGEFQILPQTKDCKLSSCGVADLPSLYQTVKYLEVSQAHYGTGDDVDSTSLGEVLEILDITKPNKPEKCKVHVRNVENDKKLTLTSTCSAQFTPLLDWRKYRAPELKNHQFGWPVRVRFVNDELGEDTEYQSLICKSPDINVLSESDDVVIITTTVSSEPDFKFCFEIPEGLEIKVAVADGFSNGARHYTDIVNTLDGRFDVTKFIASHQPTPLKRRDVIKQFDYAAIQRFIADKFISVQKCDESEELDVPAPPPRTPHHPTEKSKDVDAALSPPPVPVRPENKRKISAPPIKTDIQKTKPPVAARPRSISQDQGSEVTGNTGLSSVFQVSQNNSSQTKAKEVERRVKPPKSIPAIPQSVPSSTDNDSCNNSPISPRKDVKRPSIKPRSSGRVSTDLSSVTRHQPIDSLQAELKDRVLRKQEIKVVSTPKPDIAPKKIVPKPPHIPPPSDKRDSTTVMPLLSSPDKKQNPSKIESPVLPSRKGRPKLVDTVDTNEVDAVEQKNREHVDDEDTVPELPAKSPEIARKNLRAYSHYVEPLSPGELPSSPSAKRANQFVRSRPGTLPKNYRFGEKPQYSEVDDEMYDLPVVSVAPQVISLPPRNSPLPPTPTTTTNPSTLHSNREEDPYELIAKLPLDLSGFSVSQVSDILRNLNMGQYADRFEDEMIDGKLLMVLTESDLELFQMEPFYRKKLLRFIQGWRPQIGSARQKTQQYSQ